MASLEQVLDLNTTSFEDIIGRLKAYEERIADEEAEPQEDQTKLMHVNNDSQANQSNRGYNDYRNRGQGGEHHGTEVREASIMVQRKRPWSE